VLDLDAFIDRRLLTTLSEDGRVDVALRHRHFLTAWPPLREKIEQERDALRAREALADAAREWDEAGRPRTHLWDGRRVARAAGSARPTGRPTSRTSNEAGGD
jgi:hypothetical protein